MNRLAVFGNPVSHSRSPEIHQAFAAQCGIELVYEKILVSLDGFNSAAREFMASNAVGFNVTVPFKEDAYRFARLHSESAAQSGTVNTISIEDGEIKGDNTDGIGLVTDIQRNLGISLRGKKILVVGAGGVVRGVLGSLATTVPAKIDIINRTHSKALDVAAMFPGNLVTARKFEDPDFSYDIVISGSSAGLSDSTIDLPVAALRDAPFCYDMIYSQETTPFNQWCLESGASGVADGLGMLVEQAAAAFRIWFTQDVDTRPVIKSLREVR